MKEITVEQYLKRESEAAGADCDKHVSPGKRGEPDRLMGWPSGSYFAGTPTTIGFLELVETKAPGKTPRKEQLRNHNRRAQKGIRVLLIDTKEKVDQYVKARRPDYKRDKS